MREIRFEHVEFEYREGRPVVRDFQRDGAGRIGRRAGRPKRRGQDDGDRSRRALSRPDVADAFCSTASDIRDFRLRTYRDLLAIVQQEVFLFDGSVRDNIAYGRHDATDAEVEDAARRANAHEFIVSCRTSTRRSSASAASSSRAASSQRLAIARAILASPQILILDEATSNLDTESEQLIQASMATLLAGRTTFVIAHRLSTIRRADLILLMEDGRVIERGTHEQLMSARGMYYGMVVRQMQSSHSNDDEVFP